MLLKVKTRTRKAQTYLDVWHIGGQHSELKRPFDPYFYAPSNPYEHEPAMLQQKILLSSLKSVMLFKLMFPNTYALRECRLEGAIESHVPYNQRVVIDKGLGYDSELPTFESFDLEMDTKRGRFPDAAIDGITAASYEGENYAETKTIHDYPEYEIIHWLIDKIQERNPDVLCTYFGSFADWRWLSRRCVEHGIKLAVGRDGVSEPYYIKRTFKSGKKIGEDIIVDIVGRVHFDVWKEVAQDQTLFGIKNRKLKTVAKWFGIPVIEVDRSKIHELNAEELRAYCQSDSHATEELAKIYIRNLFPLGDYLELPFNMTVERSPSHPSNYFYMKRFRKLGIVADANNKMRYPQFAREGRKAYQGALINLFKAGVYFNIKHLDFKGMYPTILIVYWYSPENIYDVHIHSGIKLKQWSASQGDFFISSKVDITGNKISVWDKYLGIITVKVDQSKGSVTRDELIKLRAWREDVRKDPTSRKVGHPAFSQQWMIKVIMNAIPGYHGMGFARAGCYPIAAHTTGHGRFWIDKGTYFLFQQPDALLIERDTDGIYYLGENDYAKDVEELVKNLIPKPFDPSYIKVSNDDYAAGIFYEDKGYVLKEKSGKLLFHGSGLKGRHIPNLCDKAAEIIVNGIFDEDDIVGLLNAYGRDLRTFAQEDFIMTTQLRKHPDSYSEKNQYGKLIAKCKNAGMVIRWGDELQYIKTTTGYLPMGITDDFNIDYQYYMGRVANVLTRLLNVSHGYSAKTILAYLKGVRASTEKHRRYRTTTL